MRTHLERFGRTLCGRKAQRLDYALPVDDYEATIDSHPTAWPPVCGVCALAVTAEEEG